MADEDGFRNGERCGIDGCRSRRYRVNNNGHDECSNGHQHGLSAHAGDNDGDDYFGDIMGKRFRKKKEARAKSIKVLKGKEAFEMYLLCYQDVLRKMAWWVMHEKKLPKQFEVVVHDLWALRVQNLQSRLREEMAPSNGSGDLAGDTNETLFSSQRNSETVKDGQTKSSRRSATATSSIPNLKQCLAIMHLAFQVLRLPFSLADLLHWAQSGDLLYQEAYHEVPKEMYSRLPSVYQEQFRPKVQLTDAQLLFEVTRLALGYNNDYGITFPPLNVPPILFRLIEELALPLEVYPAVRRLAVYAQFDFTYPTVDKAKVTVFDFPEAQLAGLIAFVVKLFYPLDGVRINPAEDVSPAAAVIDWDKWEQTMSDADPLEYFEAMQMTDRDVIDLPDSKIDDYLDFFQEHFTMHDAQDKGQQADFKKMMLELFPMPEQAETKNGLSKDAAERKRQVVERMQVALTPNRVIPHDEARDLDEAIIRPGGHFVHIKNIRELTGRSKTFFTVLSRITGIPLKSLVNLMVRLEMHMRMIRKGKIGKGRSRVGKVGKKGKWLSKEVVGSSDMMSDVRSEISEAVVLDKSDFDLDEIEKVMQEEEDALSEAGRTAASSRASSVRDDSEVDDVQSEALLYGLSDDE